jgi:quercetin dioxygenase-like cupin family protein
MNFLKKISSLALAGLLFCNISLMAQDKDMMDHMKKDHIMLNTSELTWVDGPKSLPLGSKMAVIEGNPAESGLFTLRLKFPAGYSIKPHTHPADEHVTVIEGALYMGMGAKYNEASAKELKQGSFAVMMQGTQHYAYTKKECVVQLHGIGPWGINYINPEDDPRTPKMKGMEKGE